MDILRAIAILMVFVFHSLGASFGDDHFAFHGWFRDFHAGRVPVFLVPATFGFLGVAIFFVVSGFCIHLSHAGSRDGSWVTFFQRRFFRIYPPYLVALILFAFAFPLTALNFSSRFPDSIYQFWTHLLLVHNFDEHTFWSIDGAWWSIAVEVQLYLLYPVVLWIVGKGGWRRALWITGGIEVACRLCLGAFPHSSLFLVFLPGLPFLYWFSWTLGAALAETYLQEEPLLFSRTPLLLWPTITLIACLFAPLYPFAFLLAALSTVRVISYVLDRREPARPASGVLASVGEYLRFVGLISYSIYLLHQPLVNAMPSVLHWLFPGPMLAPLAVYASCLLAWFFITGLSYLFYRLVELPSISLGKWFIQKRRAPLPRANPVISRVGGR